MQYQINTNFTATTGSSSSIGIITLLRSNYPNVMAIISLGLDTTTCYKVSSLDTIKIFFRFDVQIYTSRDWVNNIITESLYCKI